MTGVAYGAAQQPKDEIASSRNRATAGELIKYCWELIDYVEIAEKRLVTGCYNDERRKDLEHKQACNAIGNILNEYSIGACRATFGAHMVREVIKNVGGTSSIGGSQASEEEIDEYMRQLQNTERVLLRRAETDALSMTRVLTAEKHMRKTWEAIIEGDELCEKIIAAVMESHEYNVEGGVDIDLAMRNLDRCLRNNPELIGYNPYTAIAALRMITKFCRRDRSMTDADARFCAQLMKMDAILIQQVQNMLDGGSTELNEDEIIREEEPEESEAQRIQRQYPDMSYSSCGIE
ncbi:MAG: hypothetical protein LBT03_01560 [Holosporales bacterium]|nr:hypothetical protein [Holosporales bacterium]